MYLKNQTLKLAGEKLLDLVYKLYQTCHLQIHFFKDPIKNQIAKKRSSGKEQSLLNSHINNKTKLYNNIEGKEHKANDNQ